MTAIDTLWTQRDSDASLGDHPRLLPGLGIPNCWGEVIEGTVNEGGRNG
jgi:hypothetical protein